MSRKLNIAVCSSFYKQIVEKSKELFRQDSVVELCFRQFDDFGDNSEMLECMENAEIMVCSLSQFTKSLDDFKPTTTKWVQSTSAGMDRIWKADDEQNRLKLRSCTFTKLGGTFGRPMAEYVVAGVIALERKFRLMYEQQKQKLWDKNSFDNYRTLDTLSIGILGVGDLGMEVAKSCQEMGMTVFGLARKPRPSMETRFIDKIYLTRELPELLARCDYVCNVLPSTPETKGLLSGDMLKHCKKKARFINIGRGDIIDEGGLIKALDESWIDSALLDVFQEEPLPEDSRLWDMENVLITPHCASATQEVDKAFFDNLVLYIESKPLKFVFDWNQGY